MIDYDGIAYPREPRLDCLDARRLLANPKGVIQQMKRQCRRAVRRSTKMKLAGHRGERLSCMNGWIA